MSRCLLPTPIMRRSQRAQARLALGGAAVLPVREAAALLPMADARARDWLHRKDLIRDMDGKSVVVWGDVLDVLRDDDEPGGPAPVPCHNVPRTPLRPFHKG